MMRCLLLALALLGSARAAELPLTGTTKIEHEFAPKLQLDPGQELVITGTNPTNLPVHLTLRADDSKSAGYDSRINEEHTVPPGPFTLRAPVSGWKTPSGRMLDPGDIRRIILFTDDGQGPLTVTRVTADASAGPIAAPAGALQSLPLTGATKIEHEFAPKLQLDPGQELVITGTNPTNLPVHLTLRADDGKSAGYDGRINEEHTVPPGPFTLRSPLSGWKTPSGRMIDLGDIRRIILFTDAGQGPLTVTGAVAGPPGTAVAAPAEAVPAAGELPERVALPLAGTTKLAHEFSPPLRLDRRQEISMIGENRGSEPVTLIIRVDDGQSRDYASRLNEERIVPPGKFHIRTSPGQWKTPSGRLIDLADIRQIILFTGGTGGSLDIASVSAERSFALPDGARGWKFGPAGSAVFPGFEPVLPGDPRLTGSEQRAVDRPSGDGLIGSGIRGVEHFQVPLANGRWSVALWTDDVGEWEYLPHELNRQIRVNGQLAYSAHFTPEQWVRRIYLAGRDAEALADGDPWAVFGGRRGGLVAIDVEVTDGKLTIDQQGDGPEASFLSAVLVEPQGHTAFQAVEAARRERFLDRWPLLPYAKPEPYAGPLALGVLGGFVEPSPTWRPGAAPPPAVAARGGVAMIDVMALAAQDHRQVTVTLTPPSLDGGKLTPELRWGQWSYMRRAVGSAALSVNADRLRGDVSALTLRAGLPRRLNLAFTVPETAAPGLYHGKIALEAGGETATQDLAIEILPATLPPPDRPIGLYLSDPPWYDWFKISDGERDRAMGCDLSFLSRLGLTGLAPDFVTPTADHLARFADQMAVLQDGGFTLPILAYQPVRGLIEKGGIDGITLPLSTLDQILTKRGLPAPVWSIADEPNDPGSTPADLARIRRNLLLAMPHGKIAGHLNSQQDRALLPLFDVPLINPGFGVDADEIRSLQAKDIHPWLYNMPDQEAAAGFFLWRSGAEGYIQWHGRLPTADPFDPTDGREADVMFLPVTAQSCLAVPDADALLLHFARGIDDLRWMLWLTARAKTDSAAAALLTRIRNALPSRWSEGDRPKIDLAQLRGELAALARTAP
jgi:hypothetical protein